MLRADQAQQALVLAAGQRSQRNCQIRHEFQFLARNFNVGMQLLVKQSMYNMECCLCRT